MIMESGNTHKDIFLGFKAYSETDVDIFKGREQDTEYLYNLVINKDYVVWTRWIHLNENIKELMNGHQNL